MVNRDAVTLLKPGNVRQIIADASGNERDSCTDLLLIVECRLEDPVDLSQCRDCRLARFDALGKQFLASDAKELQWRHAIAAEKAVQCR